MSRPIIRAYRTRLPSLWKYSFSNGCAVPVIFISSTACASRYLVPEASGPGGHWVAQHRSVARRKGRTKGSKLSRYSTGQRMTASRQHRTSQLCRSPQKLSKSLKSPKRHGLSPSFPRKSSIATSSLRDRFERVRSRGSQREPGVPENVSYPGGRHGQSHEKRTTRPLQN